MARRSRKCIESSFFHIMVQGLDKEYIFDDNIDKKEYLRCMKNSKEKCNIQIISYCIMDNHVHLLLQVIEVNELIKFMHRLNTLYALYYNKKYNRVGYVYRDRYKSQIIFSERQLYTCINYIHNNPVKARICKYPDEYEYSSFSEFNKDIQFNYNIKKEENDENIIFLEDEEQTEKEVQELIKDYLLKEDLELNELKENRRNAKELIKLIKNNYCISLRKMAIYLKISKETVRRLQIELEQKE